MSHAEPVWKPQWLQNVHGRHWLHAVQGLQRSHGDLLDLLDWISYPSGQIYRASFARTWFDSLCTTNAVRAFMVDLLNAAHLAPIAAPAAVASAVGPAPATGVP